MQLSMHLDCHSLATVADKLEVDTRTLGREFSKAGIAISGEDGPTDLQVALLTCPLDHAEIDTRAQRNAGSALAHAAPAGRCSVRLAGG